MTALRALSVTRPIPNDSCSSSIVYLNSFMKRKMLVPSFFDSSTHYPCTIRIQRGTLLAICDVCSSHPNSYERENDIFDKNNDLLTTLLDKMRRRISIRTWRGWWGWVEEIRMIVPKGSLPLLARLLTLTKRGLKDIPIQPKQSTLREGLISV